MKKKVILLVVVLLCVSLLFAGCIRKQINEKFAEGIAEKILEQASGGDVDVNIDDDSVSVTSNDGEMTISGGDDVEWPKNVPNDIPEWKGNLISSAVTDTSLMVGAEDVDKDDFEDYLDDVENAGFESTSVMDSSGMYMGSYTKDDIELTLTYSEENGTLTIIANWEE